MARTRSSIGHLRAMLTGLGITAYFALTTVWVPSALLRSPLLTGVDRSLADLMAIIVWGGGILVGIWVLRRAQDRGLI